MRFEQLRGRALLVLFGGSLILTGCVTGASEAIQSLSVVEFSKTPASYRGKTLRICGEDLITWGEESPQWKLVTPEAFGYHAANVIVLPCGEAPVVMDPKGCVTGRVAGFDGSLEPLKPGEIIVKDPGDTNPWFLHAQCPAGS